MHRPPRPSPRSWLSLALVLTFTSCGGCGGGGGGGGSGGGSGSGGSGDQIDPGRIPDPGRSEFHVTPAFGTPADGVSSVTIELVLENVLGRRIQGATVELEISGCGNLWQALPPTGPDGRTQGTLASLAGEQKIVRARTTSGGRLTEFDPLTTEFLLVPENTFFVRTSGSDAASGRSPLEAWRSLTHALARIGPGATLHVGAGVYLEAPELGPGASPQVPVVVRGDTDGLWTGDPGAVVIDAGGAPAGVRVQGMDGLLLQGLTVRNAGAGLALEDGARVRVLGCRLHENGIGVVARGVRELALQDCRISANTGAGVRLENTPGARVENNLIYANGAEGLVLDGVGGATLVRFNTFYRNESSHVRELGTGGAGALEENILTEGGAEAFALGAASTLEARRNLVWDNALPGPEQLGPQETIEADPMHNDPFGPDGILGGTGDADDDFRLRTGSLAIDAGTHGPRDVVLASHESLGTRSARVDGVLDGVPSSSGAPTPADLGFHTPASTSTSRSIEKGGGRIVLAGPDDARVLALGLERARPSLAEAVGDVLLEPGVLHLETRRSPLATREELVAVQCDSGTRGRIAVRHWDGRSWDERALAPVVDEISPGEVVERRFDLEYEALSGRAHLVAVETDGRPRAWILEHGRWGPARPVWTSPPGAGRVRSVRLVARPGSNELALVTLDGAHDLAVTLWDGDAWGTPRLLETNALLEPGWRPFDAAYESLSGDLLVAWGFTVFAEETRWATLERSSGQWRTGQAPSTDAVGAQVEMAADPTSDRIAVTMGEATLDRDVIVSMWDGTQWVHTAELTRAAPLGNRLASVAWLGRSGVACALFRAQAASGTFTVAYFLPTGWRIQPDVVLPGVERATKVRMASAPERNHLLGTLLDGEGRVFGWRFDGEVYSLLNAGEPLASGLDPGAPGVPFDVLLLPPADGDTTGL